MPRLAAFPKAYMQALCREGSMRVLEWLDLAATLPIEGVEWYAGFLENADPARWPEFRDAAAARGLLIPMVCCSPDFTHPDRVFREREIEKQKGWIDMTAALGGSFCRVLSGQRRPELSIDEGIELAATSIEACLPYAKARSVTLILENHYKDDFWDFPEFAQKMEVFCALVARVRHSHFGVNYDPSNAFLAGDNPLELLSRISSRVVTMHASDRSLASGTLDDLRREEIGSQGYASRLRHGEIGKGLNDYDAIFTVLRQVGFDGWISIEDGVEGFDQLRRSADFLVAAIDRHWPRGRA